MAEDTDKISINVGAMDLANIDLLVDKTVYKDRTDFFRTATRNQIDKHSYMIQNSMMEFQEEKNGSATLILWVGTHNLDGDKLNKLYAQNEMIRHMKGEPVEQVKIVAIGKLEIDRHLSLKEITEKVKSIKVFGIFRASQDIKNFYK